MTHVFIRHKVADLSIWKATYDSHAGVRQAAGLTQPQLLRSIKALNEVVILFTAADLGKVRAFATSDDLRAAMQKAGVLGLAAFCFLN